MRILAAVLLALTTACSTSTAAPKPANIDIHGTITVTKEGVFQGSEGEPCHPDSGYSDIRPGTQVVITDPTGKTIAVGALGNGTNRTRSTSYLSDCEFPFRVTAPAGQQFYGVEIGRRGRLQYAADRLGQPLELTLGD
ncbi:hypothetical protein AB0K60_19565 [Thermopolyspora sp. NPDC052614]|uniref:hypothetical protein n=1 Tax=Thermopolyspora sp. NPDC052614 TaxID=3155682 RepID=UPI00344A3E0D